jgi:hypothetical protein
MLKKFLPKKDSSKDDKKHSTKDPSVDNKVDTTKDRLSVAPTTTTATNNRRLSDVPVPSTSAVGGVRKNSTDESNKQIDPEKDRGEMVFGNLLMSLNTVDEEEQMREWLTLFHIVKDRYTFYMWGSMSKVPARFPAFVENKICKVVCGGRHFLARSGSFGGSFHLTSSLFLISI